MIALRVSHRKRSPLDATKDQLTICSRQKKLPKGRQLQHCLPSTPRGQISNTGSALPSIFASTVPLRQQPIRTHFHPQSSKSQEVQRQRPPRSLAPNPTFPLTERIMPSRPFETKSALTAKVQEHCDPQSLTRVPEPEQYPPAKQRGHIWHSAFCSDMQRETCELERNHCGTISPRSMLHEVQTVQHVPVYAQNSPKVLLV